jgi:hypothetical protein
MYQTVSFLVFELWSHFVLVIYTNISFAFFLSVLFCCSRITLHHLDFGEPLGRTLLWHSPRDRWFYGSHGTIPKSPRHRWSDVANDPDTTQLL